MLKDFELKNYGPINEVHGKRLGKINLILGKNSTGKTFLLKALYSVLRSHEESNRGNSNQDFSEVLSDKLYWTFQTEKIGDIVTKGDGKKLSTTITLEDESSLFFSFGKDTSVKVANIENNLTKRESNSIFLPPKIALSRSRLL